MAKRVSEPLRNLDDSLRVFHLLTFRSCGIVLTFFSLCHGLEWQFRIWSTLLGSLGIALELALSGAVAFLLAWVERHDDEYYVPSAIRYYAYLVAQQIPPRLLATRAAGAALFYAAADTFEMAFGLGAAVFGRAGIVLPAILTAAWLLTRPWPPLGRVVFGGASPRSTRVPNLMELV